MREKDRRCALPGSQPPAQVAPLSLAEMQASGVPEKFINDMLNSQMVASELRRQVSNEREHLSKVELELARERERMSVERERMSMERERIAVEREYDELQETYYLQQKLYGRFALGKNFSSLINSILPF